MSVPNRVGFALLSPPYDATPSAYLNATKIRIENISTLCALAPKTRIMAAMPQLPRLRIKQTAKKDSHYINEITAAAGISGIAPGGELKELISLPYKDAGR